MLVAPPGEVKGAGGGKSPPPGGEEFSFGGRGSPRERAPRGPTRGPPAGVPQGRAPRAGEGTGMRATGSATSQSFKPMRRMRPSPATTLGLVSPATRPRRSVGSAPPGRTKLVPKLMVMMLAAG